MGSVSVSSRRCCMCVSCIYSVAVLNVVFCMSFRLLMLVEDTRGDHMEKGILQSRSHYCLACSHECLPHSVAVSAFIICRVLRYCECVCSM